MPSELDADLREVIRHLAQEPAPAGLAEAAMRRARCQRRVWTAVGAAAAVAVVGVATPAVVRSALPSSDGPPLAQAEDLPSVPVEGSPPVAVAGTPVHLAGAPSVKVREPGWTRPQLVVVAYSGGPDLAGAVVLDPETGEYLQYPFWSAVPSPDGTQMIVRAGLGTADDPARTGVLDVRTRTVRWIDGLTGQGWWSPDGQEILLVSRDQPYGTGFAIVDAATLTGTHVPFPFGGFDPVWTPDGDQFALTVAPDVVNPADPHRLKGVNFYDRTGQFVRAIPADVAVHAPSDFSPDGTSVALYNMFHKEVKIVDVATGDVRHVIVLTDHVFDSLGWIDDSHLLLRLSPGRLEPTYLAVVDLAGTVVETVTLPDQLSTADLLWVRPAEGLGDQAAHLAF